MGKDFEKKLQKLKETKEKMDKLKEGKKDFKEITEYGEVKNSMIFIRESTSATLKQVDEAIGKLDEFYKDIMGVIETYVNEIASIQEHTDEEDYPELAKRAQDFIGYYTDRNIEVGVMRNVLEIKEIFEEFYDKIEEFGEYIEKDAPRIPNR